VREFAAGENSGGYEAKGYNQKWVSDFRSLREYPGDDSGEERALARVFQGRWRKRQRLPASQV